MDGPPIEMAQSQFPAIELSMLEDSTRSKQAIPAPWSILASKRYYRV